MAINIKMVEVTEGVNLNVIKIIENLFKMIEHYYF